MIKTWEKRVRSIITKSNLPDADYVINPYVGCTHACLYCYACFMRRFSRHNEPWGQFLDIKINAPDLVKNRKGGFAGKSLFLSSVTDPYLPQEKQYRLTRRILEALIPLNFRLCVQTKSALVVRDMDLLKRFGDVRAGFTLTTLDDAIRRKTEPYASGVEKRMSALKTLFDAGIETYVFIGPVLPGFTDWKAIVAATAGFTHSYMFENLNLAGGAAGNMKRWIGTEHPHLADMYTEIYKPGNGYWAGVEAEIAAYCTTRGIRHKIYFHHRQQKKH